MNLELFSCSGGLAEGLRRAGILIDLSVDFDEDACASYERNLGTRPVLLDVRDLARMVRAGWRIGPVDLLVADPPCTPWSRAGKRQGRADERDMIDATIELIRLLRPHAYLIANVPGLDDGPNWPIVQKTIGSLDEVDRAILDPGGSICFTAKKPSPDTARHDELISRLDQISAQLAALRP